MSSRSALALGVSSLLLASAVACGVAVTDEQAAVEAPDVNGQEDAALRDGSTDGGASEDADGDCKGAGCRGPATVSEFCRFDRPCTDTESTGAGTMHYVCSEDDGGTRPPIKDCKSLGANDLFGSVNEWCCSPACVHDQGYDKILCDGGTRFYYCPPSTLGGTGAPPSDKCTLKSDSQWSSDYCCP